MGTMRRESERGAASLFFVCNQMVSRADTAPAETAMLVLAAVTAMRRAWADKVLPALFEF